LNTKKLQISCLAFCLLLGSAFSVNLSADTLAKDILKNQYQISCTTYSDIFEHVPVLKTLSTECSSVVEIGLRSMVSTWGILQGLAENPTNIKSYIGIDISSPLPAKLEMAKTLAEHNQVQFNFMQKNSMHADIPNTDLLFIDSLHTYAHLSFELERYSNKINKYIAMHDTSAPWGDTDDNEYYGDYSEYPSYIDRTKKGLWLAVVDFLANHPEWKLEERRLNNHGFTVLKRVY